jgi:aerobic-type carbon monoxide dehydrogenase small subunit (CoxS/CutS family)
MQRVRLQVNGSVREAMVEPHLSLLRLLREELQLTGTKEGCSEGYCGACTVLVDGDPVNACLFFAVDADHKDITTVEGLESQGKPHPLQLAFVQAGGLQCGFCTPGMLMSAVSLLQTNSSPDENDVRQAIAGNICRCTGYQAIVSAVLDAAAVVREQNAQKSARERKPMRSRP